MIRYFLSLLIIFCLSANSFSQNAHSFTPKKAGRSINYHNKGVAAYKKGDYKKAVSFFTTSLSYYVQVSSYFNRALAKKNQNDLCGYCDDLKNAIDVTHHNKAKNYYERDCISFRTFYFDQDSALTHKDSVYSYYITINRLIHNDYKEVRYFNRNDKEVDLIVQGEKEKGNPFLIPAYFPGGRKAIREFIKSDFNGCRSSSHNRMNDLISCSFTIDTIGSIKNIEIRKGLGQRCDDELIRFVKSMPMWIPAEIFGEKVEFNTGVSISLEQYYR